MEHAFVGQARCHVCELEFAKRREGVGRWAWLGVAVAMLTLVAIWPLIPTHPVGGPRAITTSIPQLDALLIGVLAAYWAARCTVALRLYTLRRAFLRERP